MASSSSWFSFVLLLSSGCYASHTRVDEPAIDGGAVDAAVDAGETPAVPALELIADAPPPRVGRVLFDPRRGELVVLGGSMADVWAIARDGGDWRRVDAGLGGPLMPRSVLAAIDAPRDRLLVVGEELAVHALDLASGAWSIEPVSGIAPTLVDMRVDAFDSERSRLVLAGGGEAPALHALAIAGDGSLRWEPLSPPLDATGDIAYFISHGLVIDTRRDRAILFGSHGVVGRYGTWAFALDGTGEWTPIAPATPTTFGQMTRFYDPIADRVVATGRAGLEVLALSDDEPAWERTRITTDASADAVTDGERAYLFGGYASQSGRGEVTNAIRSLALGGPLDPPEALAEEQRFVTAIGDDLGWDDRRASLVRVTADTPYAGPSTEARSLDPGGRWRTIVTTSTPERIWSPIAGGSRVLRFGGHKYGEANGLYELGASEWSLRVPDGPAPRARHGVAFDERSARFFVGFGEAGSGRGEGAEFFDDLWSIAVEAPEPRWERVATGGPGPRMFPALGVESGRVLLFGGLDAEFVARDDAWALEGERWTRLAPSGVASPASVAAFEPGGRRVLAVAGTDTRLGLRLGTIDGDRIAWRDLCGGLTYREGFGESVMLSWTPSGPYIVARESGALLRVHLDAPSCE
jgi:hypothetical protein